MRVHLFIDYQNTHLSVAEAFAPAGTPPHTTLIHPGKFADALMARRALANRHGDLEQIHVYRGQPSSDREVAQASRNKAQAAEWTRDRRVHMHTRPLRYPSDWPQQRAKEKGVDVHLAIDVVRCALTGSADVIIVSSRDTDLVPALEMVLDHTSVTVEVVHWENTSRLRLPNRSLWCTHMTGQDYVASKDARPY